MDTKNLTLPNDVQEVPRLAAFVEDICEVAGFDMGTTMKMNLAIEEAVVNVMNYAYPSGVKGEVRIEAGVREGYVEFVIRDYNKPMGVATYNTSEDLPDNLRKALPDIDDLRKLLGNDN